MESLKQIIQPQVENGRNSHALNSITTRNPSHAVFIEGD